MGGITEYLNNKFASYFDKSTNEKLRYCKIVFFVLFIILFLLANLVHSLTLFGKK